PHHHAKHVPDNIHKLGRELSFPRILEFEKESRDLPHGCRRFLLAKLTQDLLRVRCVHSEARTHEEPQGPCRWKELTYDVRSKLVTESYGDTEGHNPPSKWWESSHAASRGSCHDGRRVISTIRRRFIHGLHD